MDGSATISNVELKQLVRLLPAGSQLPVQVTNVSYSLKLGKINKSLQQEAAELA